MRSPPRVLVAVASKTGSTLEIGERIAAKLRQGGVDAEVHPMASVPAPDDYDAVVLGSAVYAGRWLPEALAYARRHEKALVARPLWIFSSGPVGFPLPESTDSVHLARMLHARERRVFGGVTDPLRTRGFSRLMLRMMRAPAGDYREWPQIERWADDIAHVLLAPIPA